MLDRGLSMSDSTSNAFQGDPRLQRFRDWMQINGVQSRFCEIRPSSNGENAGFGLFATKDNAQGVLMVTPLLLAITPMTVLQDPELGGHYCKLMEEGEVDDRLLIMLFLVIERARGRFSFWAPYLEILPFKFGTPLSFSEEELSELKGTHLFQATQQQRRALSSSFNEKVKAFADTALSSVESERREVELQDFMWYVLMRLGSYRICCMQLAGHVLCYAPFFLYATVFLSLVLAVFNALQFCSKEA